MHDVRLLLAPNSGCLVVTDNTDGFRETFENGDIVHLRPSCNAPELRCYAESNTPENAIKLVNACLAQIY